MLKVSIYRYNPEQDAEPSYAGVSRSIPVARM
jgi:hypothetical protein